jgi:hypothetical protein
MYVLQTINLTAATTGVVQGVNVKTRYGSQTVVVAALKPKRSGSKLLTMVARYVALIKYQYITKRAFEKNSLRSKYRD